MDTADRQYAMTCGQAAKAHANHSDSFTGVVSFNRAPSYGSQISGSSRLSRVSSSMPPQKSETCDSYNGLRRRGCNKCVSCMSMREHYHSESARTRPHEKNHWWPGNIFSPVVYFNVRSRQLEHHTRTVSSDSKIWKKPQDMVCVVKGICARRGLSLQPLLVPITHTNVAYRTPAVILIGVKTLQISRVPQTTHASLDQQRPLRSNSKRRCVSNEAFPWEERKRETQGQQVSSWQPSKHPGIELRKNPVILQSPFVGQPKNHPACHGIYLGKVVDAHMPFSGRSRNDAVSMEICHDDSQTEIMPQKLAGTGSPPSADASDKSEDEFFMMPVLHSLPNRTTQMKVDDPTMQQYYEKQYAIKKEQAFHCHEVIDLSSIAKKEHNSSLWTRIKNNLTNLAEW